MAGRKRSQNFFQEGEHSRKSSRSIGVGSLLQKGNNATTNDDRIDLASLPTGDADPGACPLPN
jgi:hypothetical protein